MSNNNKTVDIDLKHGLLVDEDLLDTPVDELYHYGRKGMKWGKNIFGKDDIPTSRTQQKKTTNTTLDDLDSVVNGYNQRKRNDAANAGRDAATRHIEEVRKANRAATKANVEEAKRKGDEARKKLEDTQRLEKEQWDKRKKEREEHDKEFETEMNEFLNEKPNSLVPVSDKPKNSLVPVGVKPKRPDDNDNTGTDEPNALVPRQNKPKKETPVEEELIEEESLFDDEPKVGPKLIDHKPKKETYGDNADDWNDAPKKEESKKEESKKQESKKEDPIDAEFTEKKEAPKKEEPKKETPKKEESKKETPKKENSEPTKQDIAEYNKNLGKQIGKLNQKAKVAEGVSKVADQAGKATKVLGQIDNEKRIKQELSELNNAELKKINERLQLEKQYKELNQNRMSKGYDAVHKTFNLAVPVAAFVGASLSAYAQYKELFKK